MGFTTLFAEWEPCFLGDLSLLSDALSLVFQVLLDDQQTRVLAAGATSWLKGASIEAGDGDQVLPDGLRTGAGSQKKIWL